MKRNTKLLIFGLSVSLILAFFLSPLASTLPDGLEKVLKELVSVREVKEEEPPPFSPLPDYSFPGLKSERLSTGLAGAIGTIFVFAVMFILGKAVVRKRSSAPIRRQGN